ncbi:MAG: hypothetical protein CM1200mP2_24900 [Planctomycetaceae bacterium]|nr:MAG: hypothetical protein CM1200mP2_24900 [Planctomycetaceae bacterium]
MARSRSERHFRRYRFVENFGPQRGGPRLVRTVKGLGNGYASQVIAAGRVVTIGKDGQAVFARCFSEKDGTRLWSTQIGKSGRKALSTPTIDGDRVYALDPDGNLHCLQAEDGERGLSGNGVLRLNLVVGCKMAEGLPNRHWLMASRWSGHLVGLTTRWSCWTRSAARPAGVFAVKPFGPRGRVGRGFLLRWP